MAKIKIRKMKIFSTRGWVGPGVSQRNSMDLLITKERLLVDLLVAT